MRRMLFLSFITCCLQTIVCPQSLERTTKAKLEEDINYLVRTIENVHPNPYHSISKEKFYRLKDNLVQSILDSISIIDSWEGVAFLIASLNEGHSDLQLPPELINGLNNGSVLLFPIAVSGFTKDGFIVRADLSPDSILQKGDVLLSINAMPAAEVMKRLTSTMGGLQSWRELRVTKDFAVQLYMHHIRPPYTISYNRNGTISTTNIDALTKEKFLANAARLRKSATQTSEPYSFNRMGDNIGYLDFRSMSAPLDSFQKFLKVTFTAIQQNPVQGLIIDLRKNGGGNSRLGYALLTYLTEKAFRMGAGSKWKVSEEYKKLIHSSLKAGEEIKDRWVKKYLTLPAGEILTTGSEAEKPGKNPLRYTGKVCVLIGPNTFSSANMTTNAIQDYNLATLIGEPTGEPANDYGELYSGNLPNTKLPFITSTKMFIRANGDAADKNPVLPTIIVKQNPASDKDDVLDFAVKWLRQ